MTYTPQQFSLPTLAGISTESIQEHLALYEGYVKNFNAITEKIAEYKKDSVANAHALSELIRRRSFEFGGMRLHEYYFAQLEGGSALPTADGAFETAIATQFGAWENLITELTQVGMMRGPGWSILYYDASAHQFHIGFTGEQHQGHFVTLPIIVALDVWEHAYVKDYGAGGKAKYIDAFFENINWKVVEERFETAQR